VAEDAGDKQFLNGEVQSIQTIVQTIQAKKEDYSRRVADVKAGAAASKSAAASATGAEKAAKAATPEAKKARTSDAAAFGGSVPSKAPRSVFSFVEVSVIGKFVKERPAPGENDVALVKDHMTSQKLSFDKKRTDKQWADKIKSARKESSG
jgi:hypothetical protein